MRSEIFNKYAAIALEQGLLSEAVEEKSRIGSDDISTIELLYGIKPNGKEEKNIIEQAHPESVVIAPAYDRLNGIVENEIERHNMIMQIMNKPHQAKLTQHKYAEQQLMNELVRIGFLMDNQDQHELTSLADSCTEGLQKKAILPLIGAIAGGLALLGAYSNFAYLSQGIQNDCDNAIDAISKFSQQVPEISSQLSELMDGIRYIKSLHVKALKQAESISKNKQVDAIRGAIDLNNSSEGQNAFEIMERYKRAASILADRIMRVYLPIIQSTEPSEERNSSSIWTGLTNTWSAIFGSAKNDVIKMLVGANVDVIGQGGLVGSLRKSVEQITAKENAMKAYVEQNKNSLVEYIDENSKDQEGNSSTTEKVPTEKKLIDELKG